ncbi:MAG: MlaD family protein [Burkholderiales bacterium]|nr:MlaD family protein [Burkholderiales bacterium]
MESRAYALVTGVFVLGLAFAIAFWARWLTKEPVARTVYRVVATVPVSGLNPEAQVRYRGMPAGRVAAIALDPKDPRRILITIEVNDGIPVTRGTWAQLGMEGITGIAYVHLLDDGADPSPPVRGADGIAELALRPSLFDRLADGAEGTLRETRELVAALKALLDEENRRRLGATLASLERTAAQLEAGAARLPGAIERTDARLQAWLAEDNRRLARETLERLGEAAAALPDLAREVRALAAESRELVARVGRLAAEAQAGAAALREETLPRVNALAESAERSAERIARLASDLEREPASLVWGRRPPRPGPGEPGFVP